MYLLGSMEPVERGSFAMISRRGMFGGLALTLAAPDIVRTPGREIGELSDWQIQVLNRRIDVFRHQAKEAMRHIKGTYEEF